MHHTLGAIVVGPDTMLSVRANAATIQRISLASIVQSDAESIDRVLRQVPGAHLQTNSRGETLVYLRGAGERQVAVFFDGALLNVPWDNRIDLSLVPAEVVGEITVVKGPPPIVYGTNVMGGALNLTSRSLAHPGRGIDGTAMVGSYGAMQARANYMGQHRRWGYAAFAGYARRDGFGVPDGADLPYSQRGDHLRTNTNRRLFSSFGQLTYRADGGARIGLSLLALAGRKGIAPEGHQDPAVSRVRFWRYPDWHSTMLILSGLLPLGRRGMTLRGSGWTSAFGQTIHQYTSARYRNLAATQEDDDYTQGMRLSLFSPLGGGSITGALSLLGSTHRQVDQNGDGSGLLEREFRQRIYSAGVEYVRGGALTMTLGGSLDGVATPETGDKPPRGPGRTYSFMAGLTADALPGVRARASVGRKVRFPTMRELFGDALGRFLVNPDLGPEYAVLSEVGVTVEREALTAEIVAFFNRTHDAIDQRLVHLQGEAKPRRQRVNIAGSRVFGLESAISTRIANRVSLRCNITSLQARGRTASGSYRRLVEKPGTLGLCNTAYKNPGGFSLAVEYALTGRAYGLADTGVLTPLPRSSVMNARVGYLFVLNGWAAEAFARVNNATDATVLPQLGLPGPGREFHAGMNVSFIR